MDGYAALVSTKDFSYKLFEPVDKPYWSTNSGDGRYCFISASGADEVVVLDYAAEREVTRIPVGDHPQRMRMGVIRSEYVGGGGASAAAATIRAVSKLRLLRARVRRGRLELRLRIVDKARGRIAVTYSVAGRRKRFRVAIPPAKRAKGGLITWTVRKKLPARMRRRLGRVEVSYAGSAAVTSGRDRLRARRR